MCPPWPLCFVFPSPQLALGWVAGWLARLPWEKWFRAQVNGKIMSACLHEFFVWGWLVCVVLFEDKSPLKKSTCKEKLHEFCMSLQAAWCYPPQNSHVSSKLIMSTQ